MKNLLKVVDYTFLPKDYSMDDYWNFMRSINGNENKIAALCVWPELVIVTDGGIAGRIPIATVVNFHEGTKRIEDVIDETKFALKHGATEIDLVYPFNKFGEQDHLLAKVMLEKIRFLTVGRVLKVIIESGNLIAEQIIKATDICIDAKVDFIKTSTGKVGKGATIPDAALILTRILARGKQFDVGLKVSGGIKTNEQAQDYVNLFRLFNKSDPKLYEKNFRIGSSNILEVF